jgi:Acetyltransferase (GNAT) domain
LNPHSPFNTAVYAAAMGELGMTTCLFLLRRDSDVAAACLGFLRKGALSRHLEIASVPRLAHSAPFWEGLFGFCSREGVWDLDVRTYASDVTDVPSRAGESRRRKRCEFVLDLTPPDLTPGFCTNHRRDYKRGKKAGLTIQRTRDPQASRAHLALVEASMDRRKARGEDTGEAETTRLFEALLKTGAAEIFTAANPEKTLSSILILRSAHSAYYQSGGSDPDGMAIGSSKFLFAETAAILKSEGAQSFNLGGAGEEEESLSRFKAGFGASLMHSEEVSFTLTSPLQERFRTAARLTRNTLASLTRKAETS